MARIAGNNTGWRKVEINIPTGGKHVLRWEYHKDGITSYSPDCVWLDQVQWIPADGSGHTLTTPDPVPYAWLSGYGLGVNADYESEAHAVAANGVQKVWECYVAGVNPTNTYDVFHATISINGDGGPIIGWEPDLNEGGTKHERVYTVKGKENLADFWSPTNAASRFFRVKVEMP